MPQRSALLALCCMLGHAAFVCADDKDSVPASSRYELSALSAEEKNEIGRAFIHGEPLPDLPTKVEGNTGDEKYWSSTSVHMLAFIPRIELELARHSPEGPDSYYSFSLDFTHEGIDLNRPLDGRRRRNPPIVNAGERRLFRMQFPDGRMLALGIGVAVRIGLQRTDVLVCPFEISPTNATPVRFGLRSGKSQAKAQIQINYLGGVGPALALGTILTTGMVGDALEYFDRNFRKNPKLDMDYVPKPNQAVALSVTDHGLAGGIRTTLTLHNASRRRRIESIEDSVRIESMSFSDETRVSFADEGNYFARDNCFVLAKRTTNIVSYDDAPLPEK